MEVRRRLENQEVEQESISESEENQSNDPHHSSASSESSDNEKSSRQLSTSNQSDWKRDKKNIGLLLFLYLLQGIPLGMAASIPLIIQTYGASWSQQALFSFAFWPFSLKLLWAPIVDALYLKRFGRRKTWLIPIQYIIGFVMILLSYYINGILDESAPISTSHHPRIYFLTSIFFGLSFLAATQDICVDGWALSMLSKENLGWASTCNSVGQTAGYFLGNVVFLALESKDFANRFIRQPLHMELQITGLITLPGFLLFWGIIFAISTTLVALFKHEVDETIVSNEPHFGLVDTYKVLLKVLRLPSIRSMAVILLTIKIGFSAVDSMTGLELIERGVKKDSLALLAIPLTPLEILLPFFIAKYTTGRKPLNVFANSHPFRLFLGIIMALFVYFTPSFQNYNKTFPWYYYALAILIFSIQQIFVYSMFVSQMAFFAQVSDPKIGGTYMTLLNTLTNLGSSWVSTAVLYSADFLTWKKCTLSDGGCRTPADEKNCAMLGGICRPFIDPYYIAVAISTIAGIIWIIWKYQTMMRLQDLPISSWKVPDENPKKKSL
ncbi:unnamed protein product [Rotaria socialis]|uniref:Acetyl-coenzyme A transporter 1 n=4 Tax=Rotaria socialis TaxID=392032 RepID=A0A818FTS2_9BILA|nr:unnamed protein product [Rotaria socialis]CAF3232857.1 unnamed protein product [Rotaria socialis]CAF3479300.1 unnamed protein product [Rotaria socialis]CAF3567954.1 unnamed protein product [Rotaria socialis]CAF4270392.1 unnamed protein product [Rotaria socialis]